MNAESVKAAKASCQEIKVAWLRIAATQAHITAGSRIGAGNGVLGKSGKIGRGKGTWGVSYGVNALFERPNPYSGSGVSQHGLDVRLSQADRLARATGLDMVAAGWRPTVGNYLGRVTKPRILEAVREGAGERAAQLIDHLKKGDMAKEAERLLADTGDYEVTVADRSPAALATCLAVGAEGTSSIIKVKKVTAIGQL